MAPPEGRPEWADVQPVTYDDGNKVVAIQYSPDHAQALALFRAVLQSGERSARVLALTEEMIGYNQADFTSWHVRWQCVLALGPEALQGELGFTRRVMLANAKNYQLWNHRRLVALRLGAEHAVNELAFAREAIDFDEKNYHAWAHRQAILKVSGLWEPELAFCEEMLGRDVRNNSAWNQRMFVLQHMQRGPDDAAWLKRELAFVACQVARAPRNEAPWAYLTGLFSSLRPWCSQPYAMARWEDVHAICCEAISACGSCAPALDVLGQYYEGAAALAAARMARPDVEPAARAAAGQAALMACDNAQMALEEAAVADPVRGPYWQHRQAAVSKLIVATVQAQESLG